MITSKNDQVIIERDFIRARRIRAPKIRAPKIRAPKIRAPKIRVLRRDGMTQQFRSWRHSSEWSSSMRRSLLASGGRLCQLLVSRKGLQGPREHPGAEFFSEGAR